MNRRYNPEDAKRVTDAELVDALVHTATKNCEEDRTEDLKMLKEEVLRRLVRAPDERGEDNVKYVISLNVLDRRGRPSPVKASVEVKDLARPAAITAALDYMCRVGVVVGVTPCSVKAVGAPPRKNAMASFERRVKDFDRSQRGKVRLPRL